MTGTISVEASHNSERVDGQITMNTKTTKNTKEDLHQESIVSFVSFVAFVRGFAFMG